MGDWTGDVRVCHACETALEHRSSDRKSLHEFTDAEIAREYYARAQRKLGDPRIVVGAAVGSGDKQP